MGRASRHGAEVVTLGPGVAVRVFRPSTDIAGSGTGRLPALLWVHGGDYVLGAAAQDDAGCRAFADGLGIVVASVEYRLAPGHPFPAPLDDCYAGLRWLAAQPDVDPGRIAVGGASAGAGLAAALALLAKERGEVAPVLQLLSYPMLDDRTTLRPDPQARWRRLWNQPANPFGWSAYLGPDRTPGGADVPALAAPARYANLSGVAPAWLGVGSLDLFREEDLAYVERLRAAGVACDLHLAPGVYHGFDGVEPQAQVSRAFLRARTDALAVALGVGQGVTGAARASSASWPPPRPRGTRCGRGAWPRPWAARSGWRWYRDLAGTSHTLPPAT